MKNQIRIFVTVGETKFTLFTTWQIVNFEMKKKSQICQIRLLSITAANCNVVTVMQYVHILPNTHNQNTAICQKIIRNTSERLLFITTRHPFIFFYKYHARNLVWNRYRNREDCLPFHS